MSGEDGFRQIAQQLATTGYVILPAALPEPLVDSLLLHFKALNSEDFKPAGTGRADDYQVRKGIRGDEIRWLDGLHPATQAYLEWMEQLRLHLNRHLFLGLFSYECHYAYYPTGAFYRQHVDAFKGETNRILSTVLYLNPIWEPEDGGELLLYSDQSTLLETIRPTYGKLVIFLSEVFPHEVLPVQKPRCSIAGWFRVNTNLGVNLDPPK
ncbi:2OG-Fe(II) oxygenase [Leptolyngbya iicbica LK]|uniref:2OG-Fe(II) oxygenase n=2 Tax=Cyanophyceae TaxID=3028117 RepID=A0A4Q7E3V0_9CYAN|nr:2OG-Fe(II) oxygenase [Leptolyngbya sp. LK]